MITSLIAIKPKMSRKAKNRLERWRKQERAYKIAHHCYRLWLEQQLGNAPKIPASSLKVVTVDFDPDATAPYWSTPIGGIPWKGQGPEPDDSDSKPGKRSHSTPKPDLASLTISQAGMAATYARAALGGDPGENEQLLRSIEKLARFELRKGLRGLTGTTETGAQMEFKDLDDAVQAVLMDAWKAIPSFSGDPSCFRAWISGITGHKIADIIKEYKEDPDKENYKRKRKIRLGDEVSFMTEREYEDGTDECVESPRVTQKIFNRGRRNLDWDLGYQTSMKIYANRLSREIAVNQIPGWVHGLDRAILDILADGWEYIEIGQILGISEDAVKMRIGAVRKIAMEDRLYDQTIYAEERRLRKAELAGGQVARAIEKFRQQRQLEMAA